MMKIKDVQSAVALVIQGYLRANENSAGAPLGEKQALFDCLSGIRQEVGDWAENLPAATGKSGDQNAVDHADLDDVHISIGGAEVIRTPHNLVSAAIHLLLEAVDLAGPETVSSDFGSRMTGFPPVIVGSLAGHERVRAPHRA